MKTKIAKIIFYLQCRYCPFYAEQDKQASFCKKKNYKRLKVSQFIDDDYIVKDYIIPKWCPLEDYIEQ